MYRFINFNDEIIDSMLLMELSDLSKTLARNPEYEADFRVHSYLSKSEKKIYVSHFWNHRSDQVMEFGMKSDVFLRALGNHSFTDYQAVSRYIKWCESTKIPRFAIQLFTLAEDLRIEERCKKIRPGMGKEFRIRRETYLNYFDSQMKVNLEKSLFIDALFNLVYKIMNTQMPFFHLPRFNEDIDRILPLFRSKVENFFEAATTNEITTNCRAIILLIENYMKRDMLNEYFHLPTSEIGMEEGLDYNDLLRKDPLNNADVADENSDGDETVFDEEMKTWHRETSSPGNTFLQFDLDQGTQTDILADEAREGEPGDQALAIVQGSARKSTKKDFSELDVIEQKENDSGEGIAPYGKENKNAEAIFLTNNEPNAEQRNQYSHYKNSILLYQKKLKKTIDLTLEHKKIRPRSGLHFGILDKKLVKFFTDEQPRLFYKKNEESKEIDAAFSLLVDCSASMQDKMEETKRGIVLFHEALKSVGVPHEVTGFWEDANEANTDYQPNYFKRVIGFPASLTSKAGPEIMQLEPEEDNRDGFAIRIISQRLLERYEKQKFLLVFSDGEPAAYGYSQNGIVDTHEAVLDARKRGIEVFNIFLSTNGVEEGQRKVFENIYGPFSIIVPSVDLLPDILFPLLKRLLSKSI
ncbi:vWA domain-containing protein [Lederbergia citrea]|uniref:vWA domain-containing protein n=1 Tax=Lederbergia citrea TaxID=2833581 RepID=UPI001BC987D0|nr:hypothetical protein [Lederbergia citrea]MBS4176725.1 hypothetical protein [Lederbergia citrea]MBS4203286.1 hypothetical protein [Lederbergia citrea]